MGDYLCLLNLFVSRQRKGQESLFVLLPLADVELSKEVSLVVIKDIYVEVGRLVVVFDELLSTLNHDETVIRKRSLEVLVIMVHNAQKLYH